VAIKTLGSATSVVIDASSGTFFAVRLMGGGMLKATDASLNATAGCPVQL